MKPKRKNGPLSAHDERRTAILVIAVLILVAAGSTAALALLTLPLRFPAVDELPDAETLTVPFDRPEPTLTRRTYSGMVDLLIRGTGQASGPAYSDAFYVYTSADGVPIWPPEPGMFGLRIDNRRAWEALGLPAPPPYVPTHVYRVSYDVGPEVRAIAFHVDDDYVVDNSGAFSIQIAPSPPRR